MEDPIVQIDALIESGDPYLQDILRKTTAEQPRRSVRIYAALKLAELFQDVAAVPGLCEALDHRDPKTQRAAMDALWEIGETDAAGLLQVLRDAPNATRDAVAGALHRIGWVPDRADVETAYYVATHQWRECIGLGVQAVPELLNALQHWDGTVRRGAAWTLGEIRESQAVPALITLLHDIEGGLFGIGDRVCDVAAEALIKIGTDEALAAVELWQISQNDADAAT